jgi:formylglycine-generating enzyme required for sulfatase activity
MDQDCLGERTVVEFVEGALVAARRQAVETHLAGCSACSELVTFAAADLHSNSQIRSRPRLPRSGLLAPGARVGRYQILELVGRGGMGEVYAAYHPDLDRKIALKFVHESGPDTEERQARLLREARSIARLSHPNVVTVYDAGTVADRVFVAMEFVDGMTVDRWLAAASRSWREILKVFIAAGRGLAAAHTAGIVHRDFKPQNVMIARDGGVRVMDFGLARRADEEPVPAAGRPVPVGPAPEQAGTSTMLTRAGTIVGTPAYMAPEQFRGEVADARSDQFSFCVALHEALYGARPFEGENLLSLTMNVTDGVLRTVTPPKGRDTPPWIRKALLRGLRPDPATRFAGMDALIAELEADPAAQRRRKLSAAVIGVAVAASLLVVWQVTSRRRAAAEREIAGHVDEATRAAADARAHLGEATTLRERAFAAFDRADRKTGEQLWRRARALLPIIDGGFDRAERGLEAALTLDPGRGQRRARLADLRYEHLLFAEDFRLDGKANVLVERLAGVDPDGTRREALAASGTLALHTNPAASRVLLERYERDPVTGRRRAVPVGPLGASPPVTRLRPGSYRLVIDGDGRAEVIYPFEIRRAERTDVDLALPAASAVPTGFVYVPPGSFWYGDADEGLRTQFLDAAPIHRRSTGAYLIARYETTYQDWIVFLESLPAGERIRHAPSLSGTAFGALLLRPGADGWRLSIQPSSRRYQANAHEPIVYEGRTRRARQDWLRFPIGGLSPDDLTRYLAWLRETDRVPGARLCSELEWERAARGADDRLFPGGDDLAADDANFDLTYDRTDGAYGPDEVGSHPESRSPFGVDDLAGNILEVVSSSEIPGGFVARGGTYYHGAVSARSSDRSVIPRSFRDVIGGLRVCADAK